ncbi:MAG: phosphatidylglycerophosphatase A [Deltaproteobacteria bacterium]|nr:phosphatidylglycerophosphatase A [Deltaproteobacteria bacterium]
MDRVVLFLASGSYLGYAPIAPGTFGSLLALPLLVGLGHASLPAWAVVALIVAVSLAAMPICGRAGRIHGHADSSRIVLDEVCGMLIAGALVPPTARSLAIAFAAFRLFDVLKPFPAGHFDRHLKNGVGVVADDLVAGVYAQIVVRVLA